MIDKNNQQLSVVKQCKLLSINRASYYYKPSGENAENLALMKIIDQEYLKYPFFGSRQMRSYLIRIGYNISRKRVVRLMRKMGLVAIYQKPKTSTKEKSHKIYPYLLRDLDINKPNMKRLRFNLTGDKKARDYNEVSAQPVIAL